MDGKDSDVKYNEGQKSEKSKAEVDNEEEEDKGVHDTNAKGTNAKNDDVTVGFEIEGISNTIWEQKNLKSYAKRIVNNQILDLATALGAGDAIDWKIDDCDPAFGYVKDKSGKAILGLYLDTPPKIGVSVDEGGKLEFNTLLNSNFDEILNFPSTLSLELKSISDGICALDKADTQLETFCQIVQQLRTKLALNIDNKLFTVYKNYNFEYNLNTSKLTRFKSVAKTDNRVDINYGVPKTPQLIKEIKRKYSELKNYGIGYNYKQDYRSEYPMKAPLEFLNEKDKDIIPPTGISYFDISERIKHLRYILVLIKNDLNKGNEDTQRSEEDMIIKRIDKNIKYYNEAVKVALKTKKNIAKDAATENAGIMTEKMIGKIKLELSSNVFHTAHHSMVTAKDKIIFEIRDAELNYNIRTKEVNLKINGNNEILENIYNDNIKKEYLKKKFAINLRTLPKNHDVDNINFSSKKTSQIQHSSVSRKDKLLQSNRGVNNASYGRPIDASQNEAGSAYGNSNNIKTDDRKWRSTAADRGQSAWQHRIVRSQVKQKIALVPRTVSIDTPYENYNVTTAVNSTYILKFPPQKLRGKRNVIREGYQRPFQNQGEFIDKKLKNQNFGAIMQSEKSHAEREKEKEKRASWKRR